MKERCWYRAEKNVNAPWIEAYFYGFHQAGDVKTGIYTFALVVPANADLEPTGYCSPRKIFDFKDIRFDEAIVPIETSEPVQ